MTSKERTAAIRRRHAALEAGQRKAWDRTRDIRQRQKQYETAAAFSRTSVWSDGSVGVWRSERLDDGRLVWTSPAGRRGAIPPPELRRPAFRFAHFATLDYGGH